MMMDIVMRAYGIDARHGGGFVETIEEAIWLIQKDRAKKTTSV